MEQWRGVQVLTKVDGDNYCGQGEATNRMKTASLAGTGHRQNQQGELTGKIRQRTGKLTDQPAVRPLSARSGQFSAGPRLYLVGSGEGGNLQSLGTGGIVEDIIHKKINLGVVEQGDMDNLGGPGTQDLAGIISRVSASITVDDLLQQAFALARAAPGQLVIAANCRRRFYNPAPGPLPR